MNAQQLYYGAKARTQILSGVNKVADAVKCTLGAAGRNVAISRERGKVPDITKDGVTVARAITSLLDPLEDIGAQLIKQAASTTMDAAGDGTTTSTVLAQRMIILALQALEEGANPRELQKGIRAAVEVAKKYIASKAVQVEDNYNLLNQIANISANNDAELGKMIADVMSRVGEDGLVRVAESPTTETYHMIYEGVQLDRGYLSPHFINIKENQTAEFLNCLVLLYDGKISKVAEIQPLLERVKGMHKTPTPILIVADDIEGEALFFLVANAQQIKYPFCAIKAPLTGSYKDTMMEDLAVILGATVVSEKKGHDLKSVTLDKLGSTERLVVSKNTTVFLGGAGEAEDIAARIKLAQADVDRAASLFEKDLLQKRLAIIASKIAIIYVGGHNEVERGEKKARIDDAIHATRAAIQEGIVVGGGITLNKCRAHIYAETVNYRGNVNEGVNIILESLSAPFEQILENASVSLHDRDLKTLAAQNNIGFNVLTEATEDMFVAGIIDPAKVVRVALENAASVTSILLSLECAITN